MTNVKNSTKKKQKSKPKILKNNSDLIKVPKKKLTIINNSSLGDEEKLKGSIPGLPGHRVMKMFGPLLTEYQKVELSKEK